MKYDFALDYSKFNIKLEDKTISKKDIEKVIKKHVKENKKHFEEYGFDLDVDHIRNCIFFDLFQINLDEYFYQELCKVSEVHVRYSSDETSPLLCRKDGYYPVYYDMYEDEIIIVENSRDKSYLFDYKEDNGYIELGFL